MVVVGGGLASTGMRKDGAATTLHLVQLVVARGRAGRQGVDEIIEQGMRTLK